jgi:tripartite-type tricarboxylate transporter receptor subunit TctC
MTARFSALVLGALIACACSAAFAQAYPAKPVRVVVPWPPGGSNDIVGRVVAQKLTEITGQQFIIDNRGGASGIIGSEGVAKSPPDGYTIMVHSATHVANPHLYKKVPYDTMKDFVGIAPLSAQIGMLAVHPSLPVKTTKDLIALAKARPGQIIYGSSGSGSFVHLTMALLNVMTGTKMIHIPYKGGGPATVAIASGETQAMIATIGSLIPSLSSGRVRAIAVTSDKRVAAYPDVPTIAESGVPGYEFTAWIGALGPAGLPKPIVDKLNADMQKVLRMPDVAKTLNSQTLEPMFMTPEQFAQRLKSDYDKYEKVIRVSGAKVE